jgi:hypothetical protein
MVVLLCGFRGNYIGSDETEASEVPSGCLLLRLDGEDSLGREPNRQGGDYPFSVDVDH